MTKKKNSDQKKRLSATDSNKPMRRVLPLGMRVLVQLKELDEISDGGLYLPETAKSSGVKSLLAEVLEVASAIDDQTHEETNISGIPMGALVLIGIDVGTPVPWDASLRLVDSKDILAIVQEMALI